MHTNTMPDDNYILGTLASGELVPLIPELNNGAPVLPEAPFSISLCHKRGATRYHLAAARRGR